MHRAVSTLLMLFLLVSQSLVSAPHSHVGSSVVEPQDHDVRAHVHLGYASRHRNGDDGDQSSESLTDQLPDHDSDAVYAGDDQFLHVCKIPKVVKAELTAVRSIDDDSSANAALSRRWILLDSPAVLRLKCALYLQFLSIRC